ncbi:hypothetical protein EDD90_10851 [Streptomyces sp. Ag109_O5-1]|nr:hypothetical protein EDD90_10851 [Streptomyces sp. Ag109_O5-1]
MTEVHEQMTASTTAPERRSVSVPYRSGAAHRDADRQLRGSLVAAAVVLGVLGAAAGARDGAFRRLDGRTFP